MPRCLLPSPGAVLLLSCGWVACASAPDPAPRPPLPAPAPPARITDAGLDAIAELLRLEDHREYDEARLRSALAHPHPEVRRRAALAVGRIGDRRGTALLLDAVADTSPLVRADAAFALGELGDSSSSAVRTLAALARRGTRAAKADLPATPAASAVGRGSVPTSTPPAAPPPPRANPDSTLAVSVEAVGALGKLGSLRARDEVEALLRWALAAADGGNGPPPAVVAEALLAIWRLPRTPGFAALVEPFTRPELHGELRWRAVYALMRAGDPRGADALLAALGDPDPLVRSLAARGLRAPLVDSAARRDPAVRALVAALDDEHPYVRINALRALATFRDDALARAVAPALRGADPNVALVAAEALGALGGDLAAAALRPVVLDPSARLALRAAALGGLLRSDPAAGAATVEVLAASPEWLARLYAARALAASRWRLAEPHLRRLAADPDVRVQAAALRSLAVLVADTIPGARALYIQGLASRDPVVRAAALHGLARRADPGDLPLLMEAFAVAQRDTLNDALLAAVDALGALAAHGVPVARSFFLRFSRSEDPLVRAAVADRLDDLSWGAAWPARTGRPLAFYRSIVRELVVPEVEDGVRPLVRVHTVGGSFTLELSPAAAPLTVHNFLSLARKGFFDGGRWHRVVPNFVLQGGDPRGDGAGGPAFAIRDEINRTRYLRGTLGMALSGPDTGGSQFFIAHSPQPHLDGGYTAFGRIVAGLEIADAIMQDDPIASIEVLP